MTPKQHADEIRKLYAKHLFSLKQTVLSAVKIGNHLIAVKKDLDHGKWLPWLKREFEWSRQTADNFIRVAQAVPTKLLINSNLKMAPTELYKLLEGTTKEGRRETYEKLKAKPRLKPVPLKKILENIKKRKGKPLPRFDSGKLPKTSDEAMIIFSALSDIQDAIKDVEKKKLINYQKKDSEFDENLRELSNGLDRLAELVKEITKNRRTQNLRVIQGGKE